MTQTVVKEMSFKKSVRLLFPQTYELSGSCRNGLASPVRCMVRENRDYTSIVRLFVMKNSRCGSLTNKFGCRNSLTPRDLKNHGFCLLSVNYTGAVKFF